MDKKNLFRTKYVRIIAGLLAIVWMAVIFSFSAAGKEESGATSRGVSYQLVVGADSLFGLGMADGRIMEIAEAIEGTVRKIAHMVEFGILAMLFAIAGAVWNDNNKKMLVRLLACLLLCSLYAATDEIHQLFIPGRNGSIKDVFIDACGSFITLVLGTIIWCQIRAGEARE